MASLYVAKGVNDYLDFHANAKLLYHYKGDSKPSVVSFNSKEPDIEKKRKDLESKLNLIYMGISLHWWTKYQPWPNNEKKTNNEKNGLYEGSAAVVRRIPKSGHTLQHFIKDIRTLTSAASGIIQFFGWKEVGNHYLLAYERFPWDLQSDGRKSDLPKLAKCKSLELRDLIEKVSCSSPPKDIRGLTNVLDEGFVKEKVAQRPTMPYDYTDGCDLVRIFRNGFSHHGEMDKKVREKVGKTKADMVLYLNSTFPKLVMSLHTAGLGELMRSYTKPSEKMIPCTIKGKPLVLPWGRTPRLDSDVRVSPILGFPSISLLQASSPYGP
ncbi:gypsy type transposase [Tanacetum coccineum]